MQLLFVVFYLDLYVFGLGISWEGDKRKMKEIIINTKEEYDKVQNELLAKGYKWIDGSDKYYDLFECANGFYKMRFVIHKKDKTFEWRFLDGAEK